MFCTRGAQTHALNGDFFRLLASDFLSPLDVFRLAACQRLFRRWLRPLTSSSHFSRWSSYYTNEGILEASEMGYRDLVDLFIQKKSQSFEWRYGVRVMGVIVISSPFLNKSFQINEPILLCIY